MVEIQKGIPVVPVRRGRPPKYRWHEMEIGDCFTVRDRTVGAMRSAAHLAAGRTGHAYNVANVDEGVRVWRVA